MLLQYIRKTAFGKRWISDKIQRFRKHLPPNIRILDIGAGTGFIAKALQEDGWQVQAVDVKNLLQVENLPFVCYSGGVLPFADKSFDTALLLTVLHHCQAPKMVLAEALRIAHQVIILEDTYTNAFQKYLTFATDTLVNFGFSAMTYQNRSDAEWRDIFENLGAKLTFSESKSVLFFFTQTLYVVSAKDGE